MGCGKWRGRLAKPGWPVSMALVLVIVLATALAGLWRLTASSNASPQRVVTEESTDSEARFQFLSTHGNSNCSRAFLNSIPSMPDDAMLQGSCCSPMDRNRYGEQIESLKTYGDISVMPADPYDISVRLAKKLLIYDATITPTSDERAILDTAVSQSNENGYCCCKCWRWSVYEGLSRYLVRYEGFNASQVTDVLNNSDGCGG